MNLSRWVIRILNKDIIGSNDFLRFLSKGAIQGPGEFAEGLALGVRSLFGHTVGGAAGAMSRITGAMGKGIAALTFDDDFQRKRREQISKKPASAQEGFARSGKGLVMVRLILYNLNT